MCDQVIIAFPLPYKVTLARPGRFSEREPMVHVIDNWVLDQVLDTGNAEIS